MPPPSLDIAQSVDHVSVTIEEMEQTASISASTVAEPGHVQLEDADQTETADTTTTTEGERQGAALSRSHVLNCSKCATCILVQKTSFTEHVVFFCSISIFAYFGMLARVYLSELVKWSGLPFFPSFYPEVVGTTIMGFVISHKQLLKQRYKITYDALTIGLCGSITTFSSWNNDAATVILQYDAENPDNVTRIVGWATVLLIGFAVPLVALRFGKHLGYISPYSDQRTERQYANSSLLAKGIEMATYIVLWVVITSIVVVVPLVVFGRYDFMFSFLLASIGAYIRWHLSPWNNDFCHFRPGTFTVNVLGTWLLATASVLEHHYEDEAGEEVKGLLYGVITGFCGCLTTVSTFAVELESLSLFGTYLYGLLSVLVAQVGLVGIRGSYLWTR